MNSPLNVDRATMSREDYAKTTVPLVTRGRAVSDAARGGPAVVQGQNDARRDEEAPWVHTLALTPVHRPARIGMIAETVSEVPLDAGRERLSVGVGWLERSVVGQGSLTEPAVDPADGDLLLRRQEAAINERSLADAWLSPEDDEAWRDL